MERKKSTSKQRRFVHEYVTNGGNATQAALEVYNTTDNATARAIGHENLTKPHIHAEIERLMGNEDLGSKMPSEPLRRP